MSGYSLAPIAMLGHRLHSSSSVVYLIWFACIQIPIATLAQDEIVFKNDDNQIKTRSGRITQWLGNEITLVENGRRRTIDSDRIVKLETRWPQELEQARQLVANNDLRTAISTYSQGLENEPRDWVKQIFLAELVQAFDAAEASSEATRKFLQLYQLDSQTRFFHLIPLNWATAGAKPPAEAETAKWMGANNSLLRLIGASWQLAGPKRGKAVEVLEDLTSDPDKRIAQLAATQLWRTRSLSANESDVARWQRQIENIDAKLQAGPLIILADAQLRVGRSEQAQISLMKVPILFPEKKSLAAFALFRCGTIREDNTDQASSKTPARNAVAIWQELIRDYPASQYAKLARGKL